MGNGERSLLDIGHLFVQQLDQFHSLLSTLLRCLATVHIVRQLSRAQAKKERDHESNSLTCNRQYVLVASGMLAQQTAQAVEPAKGAAQGVVLPEVGDQLKVLTQKLDLSVDQQPKVKTILQELHDASLKLMQDESTSHEELLSKVRPLRMNADKKIREILSNSRRKNSINTCRARTRRCMAT